MNAFAWFFLSLRGRVSRQEFWLGYLGIVVIALILVHSLPYPGGAIYFLPGDTPDNEAWRNEVDSFGWPDFISLAVTWPVIAIYAKRLHDLNLSAWWLLLLPAVTFVAGLSEFWWLIFCFFWFSAFCPAAMGRTASARIRLVARTMRRQPATAEGGRHR